MNTAGTMKAAVLLIILMVLFTLMGRQLAGTEGAVFAFGLALLLNLGAYWFSDRIALAMVGAREVSYNQAPELHKLVERLASRSTIPKPRVYVLENRTPNAFSSGRNAGHAVIGVTTGILPILDRDELAAVLAHELAHIKNRDISIATVVGAVAGTFTMIAHAAHSATQFRRFTRSRDREKGGAGPAGLASEILMVFLAPIAATIVHLAISRSREYAADATGALILGDPLPLARALEKLEQANRAAPMQINPALAHQFTVQPLGRNGLTALFGTHPPTVDRIARLRQMALRPTSHLEIWNR